MDYAKLKEMFLKVYTHLAVQDREQTAVVEDGIAYTWQGVFDMVGQEDGLAYKLMESLYALDILK